jgi:signal peptidase I
MTIERESVAAKAHGWGVQILQFAAALLIVFLAKGAIAEPFYVPSGSMEPTLQIGDELLATKYPYGYSSASLPPFINLPDTQRILAALPQRGDVVVFRWPGDRSQIWVKRVIGLPGDRIAMRNGRVWINGAAVALKADGMDQAETEDGSLQPVARFIETLPGNRSQPSSSMPASVRSTTCLKSSFHPTRCLSWATIATTRRIAGLRSMRAASACCRSATWSDGLRPW